MTSKDYIFENPKAALALEAVAQGKKFFSDIKAYIEAGLGVNAVLATEAREIIDELIKRGLIKPFHNIPNIYVVTDEGKELVKEGSQN
ncbi:MAG: hypothetical protein FWE03_01285 [Firmicutes bacterium]|nr:hypothetical protein [Bacillota bacterium]